MSQSMPLEADALHRLVFLKGMSSAHVERMRAAASLVSFAEGEIVAKEGEPATEFFIVRKGELVIECLDEDGNPIELQTVGRGELLGWSWIVPPNLWTFDVRAVKPTSAIRFDGKTLRQACCQDPALGFHLMLRVSSAVAMRLQETRSRLASAQAFLRRESLRREAEAS